MLEWIFIFCFALGIIYALFAAIFAGIFGGVLHTGHDLPVGGHDVAVGGHDVAAGGHDVGVGHDFHGMDHSPETSFSPVSPPVISMFAMTFGGAGLMAIKTLGWQNPAAQLAFALGCGIGVGFATFCLFLTVFKHSQVSSAAKEKEIVGKTAEIIVPLPAHGTGEIAFTSAGRRFNAPAKTPDGRPLPQGMRVVIEKLEGNTYVVHEDAKK